MDHSAPSYGLWLLVAINVAIFAMFAFSFFKPTTARDWRSFGAFTAFIVALFVEMYGFPLTIYFMAGWLGQNYPEVDFLSHDAGHLLELLFGWGGDPHWGPFHILSYLFIGGGFWILAKAWPKPGRRYMRPSAKASWRSQAFTPRCATRSTSGSC